jgi:hypothetical protein
MEVFGVLVVKEMSGGESLDLGGGRRSEIFPESAY